MKRKNKLNKPTKPHVINSIRQNVPFLYLNAILFLRADEDAGFTSLRYRDVQEKNYNHDIRSIKLSSSIIGKARKKLNKLQEDIRRKSQKKTSKELEQCKQAYDKTLADMVAELKQLMAVNDPYVLCTPCYLLCKSGIE